MLVLAIWMLTFYATVVHAAAPPVHPLDPLSQQELVSAVTVLNNAGVDLPAPKQQMPQ